MKLTGKRLRPDNVKADNGVAIEGRRECTSIYIRDPNGYCLEYHCD